MLASGSAQDMRCSGLKATTRLVKLTSALFSGGLVENSSTVPLRSLVKKMLWVDLPCVLIFAGPRSTIGRAPDL